MYECDFLPLLKTDDNRVLLLIAGVYGVRICEGLVGWWFSSRRPRELRVEKLGHWRATE